jgi:hypothetical protein
MVNIQVDIIVPDGEDKICTRGPEKAEKQVTKVAPAITRSSWMHAANGKGER